VDTKNKRMIHIAGRIEWDAPDFIMPWAKSSTRPDLEKSPSQKRVGGVAEGVGPEFKPQY
jgi:hypothetical protein